MAGHHQGYHHVLSLRAVALVVSIASFFIASAEQPQLLFNGRFVVNAIAAFPQRFTWASTTVHIPFVGDGVTVALACVPGTCGSSHFELSVDGRLMENATVDSTTPKNISIPNLGHGTHTLAVTKISEAMFGEALLTGVHVDGEGFSAQSLVPLDRRIETIGASVTNGFGDLGPSMGCTDLSRAEDSMQAVGALVARHFGARFAQIAWAGAGIFAPGGGKALGNGSSNPTIPEAYARASPRDPTLIWDPSNFVPHVVIMDAGGNDFNGGTVPPGWLDAYKTFLKKIRANAPDAHIVLLALPDSAEIAVRGSIPARLYAENLKKAKQDLDAGGFHRLTLLQLPNVQDGGGCNGHPTADTHAAWSKTVEGLVGNLTGWSAAKAHASFLPSADAGR